MSLFQRHECSDLFRKYTKLNHPLASELSFVQINNIPVFNRISIESVSAIHVATFINKSNVVKRDFLTMTLNGFNEKMYARWWIHFKREAAPRRQSHVNREWNNSSSFRGFFFHKVGLLSWSHFDLDKVFHCGRIVILKCLICGNGHLIVRGRSIWSWIRRWISCRDL